MSRKVLTDGCVIQCAHGGTVIHPSSDTIRTIGGLKPNFCSDILGAAISGCPKKSPCTKVASISSAMTETNVVGSSGNYALDVAGCTTNKGAALTIVSRANKNSFVAPKVEADNSVESEEPTQLQVREAKEKKLKESYNLYLLRDSQNIDLQKVYKPLRGSRKFEYVQTYYGTMDTPPSIREKVIPFTLSYVYVRLSNGDIEEYKLVNKGSVYAETFKDIKFEDEEGIQRDYIPLYDGEEVEIFYSQVQCNKTRREDFVNKLLGVKFDPTDANKADTNFFLKDPNALNSNIIEVETFKLQKEYDPIKEDRPYPFNVLTTIPDPLGQAEDILELYEFQFKDNFAKNNLLLTDLKKKNAYTYAVADKIDYFYVDKTEQEAYDKDINTLKDLYKKFANEIQDGKFSSLIIKGENDIASLDSIIDPVRDTAVNYFNRVSFINKSFFKNVLATQYRFTVTSNNLSCKYIRASSEGLSEKNTYIREQHAREQEFNKNNTQRSNRHGGKRNTNYGYLLLDDETNYKDYKDKPAEMLALLVFGVFFSKKYEAEVKEAGLYASVQEFERVLTNAQPLPCISDENIKDVQELINKQTHSYAKIASGEIKLLEQFEEIDLKNKEFSYDVSKIESPTEVFSDLYRPKELKSFYKSEINPQALLQEANELINREEFKQVLKAYQEIGAFDNAEQWLAYLNTSQGILFSFLENRSDLDTETTISSAFNNEKKHLLDFVAHIVKNKNKIINQTFFDRAFDLPVRDHYSKLLEQHIGHAFVETENNEQGFDTRKKNAQAFFKEHAKSKDIEALEKSGFLEQNFGIEKEQTKTISQYYAGLVTMEGMVAKFGKVLEEHKKIHGAGGSMDDMYSKEETKQLGKVNNSAITKQYKPLLSSIKVLSVLVAGVSVATGAINYNKLKYKDIFPLIGDMYTTTQSLSKIAPKTSAGVVEAMQKLLNYANLEKIATWKLMAKVGIAGIVVSAVYDIQALEEGDTDATVAIVTKNVLVISLLLVPALATVPGIGWIAALGILSVEIAWHFYLRDMFVDTPLESHIMKTLLFHQYDDINAFAPLISPLGYAIYRYTNDKPYQALLFGEAVQKQEKDLVQGFESLEELQTFIGENHDKYEELFNNALQYELTSLRAVAFGYKIEILDTVKKQYKSLPQILQTQIKIPKEMLRNNIEVLLKIDDDYHSIYASALTPLGSIPVMGEDFSYDLIQRGSANADINSADAKKLSQKDVSLFIVNRDIALKYKVEFYYSHHPRYGRSVEMLHLKIKTLELFALETQEKTLLQEIVQKRQDKEKSL